MKIELTQDEVTAVLQAIGAHSINTHVNLYFNIRNQMEAAQAKAQVDVQEAMAALDKTR
jgi:hypothetical protein